MMKDPYLYPGTDILRNKAGIRSKKEAEMLEGDLTAMRLAELVSGYTIKKYDFHGLCRLHYHIFQDVYDWAGKPRVVNIEKSEPILGGLSVEYSDCFDIETDARHVLQDMERFQWRKATFHETVKKYSYFMASLWKVHPFREGNTRTTVL